MSEFKRAKMTGWYDPGQLAVTAVQVLISTIFGRHADRRLFEGASNKHGSATPKKPADPASPPADSSSPTQDNDCCPEPFFYDASEQMEHGEFWFDYICDVGDGFNSTYTMAYHVSEPTLELGGEITKRGRILVLGGDEVYPIASEDNYKNNLIGPYETALARPPKGQEDTAPVIFAIPGNHDWYDSLAGFSFLFLENHFGKARWFGGWQAKQERSYFAIKLPAGWWLFGTDMQLSSSLDTPQMEYFHYMMEHQVKDGERIILCNAEPSWITQEMYRGNPAYDNDKIGFFEGRVLGRRTDIFVSGDRHYYKRHEEMSREEMVEAGFLKEKKADAKNGENEAPTAPLPANHRRQRIVAGGGGAFLHPTHKEKVKTVGRQPRYKHKASFPSESTSWWLGLWNLLFLFWNWKFGLVTGFLYVLTSWAFIAPIGEYDWSQFTTALKVVLWRTVEQPLAFFWLAAIFGGFFLFTDTTSRIYRFVGGTVHGLAHLAGVFFVSWRISRWIDPTRGDSPVDWSWEQLAIGAAAIFLGGFVVGPTIMGLYLFVSLNLFGRHHNEAFSAIMVEDYKNFLRFKIEANGDLVIYPVGVKKVFKKWRDGDKKKGERKIMPETIEEDNKPIMIEEQPIRFVKTI